MSRPVTTLTLATCALVACDADVVPQVIVELTADDASQSRAQSLRVSVWNDEGELAAEPRLEPALVLPATIPLTARDGDASRRFVFQAELLDDAGAAFHVVRAASGYEPGRVTHLALRFDDACADVSTTCALDETCSAGTCTDACVGPLPAVESGMLAYYPMEGLDDGRLVDGAPGGRDGRCTPDTTCPSVNDDGRVGACLDFDGENDAIAIEDWFTDTEASFTVSLWLLVRTMPADTYGKATVVVKPRPESDSAWEVSLKTGDTGSPELRLGAALPGGGVVVRGGSPGFDEWIHFAGSYNGRILRTYINGAAFWAEEAPDGIVFDRSTFVSLGAHPGYSDRYLDGMIDELRIHGRALCAAEVSALAED